jgi:hypothetical protein
MVFPVTSKSKSDEALNFFEDGFFPPIMFVEASLT